MNEMSILSRRLQQQSASPRLASHVATTILEQLGGRTFIAMTGAVVQPDAGHALALRVELAYPSTGVNFVRVRLNAMDLYDVEFLSLRGVNSNVKAYRENIYAEDLQAVFTAETGLYTRL